MTSSEEMLSSLMAKTEANIKRIESINGRFVSIVLNEWRYVTRHMVRYHVSGENNEIEKAIGHMKRAYFDSCDILMDVLLNRISVLDDEIRGYASIVATIVPGFNESRIAVHKAKEAHRTAGGTSGEDREKEYESLVGHCARLERYLDDVESTKEIWQEDIRKQKYRDRIPVIWTVAGIVVSIVLAVLFK